jgi:Ni/Fe-hydrogenase 1 B-type cytochrome subunit
MTAAVQPGRAPRLGLQRIDPEVDTPAREHVYVWDLVVRATHWLIASSIAVLSVTGVYIGRPFLSVSGPAGDHFVMGWMRVVHSYAAIVFSLAVAARLVWMFRGPATARWDQFIPIARARRRDMVETFEFYMLLRKRPPPGVGHNPLAGASYAVVFLLYLLMIATGLSLYGASASVDSYMRAFGALAPMFGGAQTARWIHHATMWLLLGFTVHHVYSALLTARVEKNGTIDSIFSGYKYLPPGQRRD